MHDNVTLKNYTICGKYSLLSKIVKIFGLELEEDIS